MKVVEKMTCEILKLNAADQMQRVFLLNAHKDVDVA